MFEYVRAMNQQLEVLLKHQLREWELLRGIYNNAFNNISRKKVIEDFCYENLRKEIWLKRCEGGNEIEKEIGFEKKDKRKCKERSADFVLIYRE
ncbi:hypothetical protein GLOIN_2v1790440 [Rhizophagus irregularis DAOM 181602=DAOM 197198]|uniref:Uncharacterized protein n=1 Tax=Rhizophagus irregularis (strain DAOM 181602 / DAOM 197198 / MUCL 43194) TaxID=747089 RepID=A0A2P4NZ43_RHIID|nr:hypothetical protein GLOIN_2v1790440 [Rhizophagus irregularis DAOM 181602=DAOM 197198]POG58412.1 hypothetical protein GLOIN_2v1790440 [Rhizophagus irregularis DAOM 181602=DAOM 197198]|eukprot:XP_025165278.1 hypothetical protein GLOIN_2v1790440 [Rhizophagus irregularis DAOM 181602=DAOM 197198]